MDRAVSFLFLTCRVRIATTDVLLDANTSMKVWKEVCITRVSGYGSLCWYKANVFKLICSPAC